MLLNKSMSDNTANTLTTIIVVSGICFLVMTIKGCQQHDADMLKSHTLAEKQMMLQAGYVQEVMPSAYITTWKKKNDDGNNNNK